MICSRGLPSWLATRDVSFAFTSYQSGRVYLVGSNGDGRLSVHERHFDRAMALWAGSDTLYLSTLFQLWRLENDLLPEKVEAGGADRRYVPRVAWNTGDIDIHEIAPISDGRVLFVSTLYSCIAELSETHSFRPVWKPSFISALAAEDRCHLNGMAMRADAPAFVTAVSRSDVVNGWRARRESSGVVIDVASNEIVAEGLSMPHSPRWHRGQLWLLNSGTGELGRLDLESGKFEPLCFLPGFLRGLDFLGDFALVGLSKPRDGAFGGLPLDDALKQRDAEARCGVHIVDLRTGSVVEWLEFETVVGEIFSVSALPNVRLPLALGLRSDEIRTEITADDFRPLVSEGT